MEENNLNKDNSDVIIDHNVRCFNLNQLERNSTTNHVASGCFTQLCGSTNIDNTLPGFMSSAHLSPELDDLSRLSDISGQSSTGLFDVDDFLGVFFA
ncbi:unnamed protein product [Clavelina lepadiformis]|uniref:Uncharacterized protein n=1 Tax=Clavelina lepadiformis TaxID=159417 RepID=A0ABP0FQJ4_CLALP